MKEREAGTANVRSAARVQPAHRLERALAGLRLPLTVSLLVSLAGLLAWRPSPLGIWHDDGVYAQLGRALADGHGYHLVGVPGSPAAARFPPGYPALLAPIWRIAPSPELFASLAVGLNFVLLALAAGAFALYLRDRLRLGGVVAAVAAIAGWLHLQLWYTAFVPLSEPLFMLLLVATLASLERAEAGGVPRPEAAPARQPEAAPAQQPEAAPAQQPESADASQRELARRGQARSSRWHDALRTMVLPVLLLLLLVHTRSIGVAFVAGAIVGLATRRRWRPAAAVALATGAGMLPWWWWSGRATAALPEPLRDMLGAYPDWLSARITADPGAFMFSLGASAMHLATAVTRALFPAAPAALLPVLGPIAVAGVAAGARLLGRRSPAAACGLAAYLLIVLLWPFPDIRLVAAIAPLLLLCAVLACLAAWRAVNGRGTAAAVTRGAIVVWLAAHAVGATARLLDPESTQMQAVRSRQLEWAMAAIAQATEPDAVIGAPELWPAIPLHTGRLGAPSAPFRPGATDRPAWGLPEDQYRVWSAARIDYLVTEGGRQVHGEALDRLDAACPGALVVVAFEEGVALVRLGWDERCRDLLGVATDRMGESRQGQGEGQRWPWSAREPAAPAAGIRH